MIEPPAPQPGVRRSVWPIVLLGGAATLSMLVISIFVSYAVVLSCSGDGGSPYAARDSTYGELCSSGAVDVWAVGLLVLPPAAMVVAYGLALGKRRLRLVAAGLGVGLALHIGSFLLAAVIPDRCTEAQRASGANCEVY